jgi:hypothetical protein
MSKTQLGHLATLGRGKNAAAQGGKNESAEDKDKKNKAADGEEDKDKENQTAAPEGDDEDDDEDEGENAASLSAESKAARAERKRCAAIIQADAAQGRESLAQHFAFATDLSAAQAITALAAAPQAGEQAAGGSPGLGLSDAMRGQDQPKLGAQGGAAGEANLEDLAIAAIKKL